MDVIVILLLNDRGSGSAIEKYTFLIFFFIIEFTHGGVFPKLEHGSSVTYNCESFKFDLVYTSVLKRAIHTMELCLDSMNINKIPIKYDWRLNERHYGALQGFNKS